ncbi:MAG TPA: hypothetical protein G4O00_09955 [Thermoflexia bacterium]|jgi:predicted AlkP superfamily phosphohydrolase/phosphomutase|nr:hypothetical protein [Thermoflexia bacterium]
MPRVLMIGIDSLAPTLLSELQADLPTFSQLRRQSPPLRLTSIFPIDSIPAWATIFTGLNPAKHGLIYSFDVFEANWGAISKIDSSVFRGRTFWDYAGQGGKKVCILFPLLAYPAWPVNGVMLSRSLTGAGDAWPRRILDEQNLSRFETLSGRHPGRRRLLEYAQRAEKITEKEAAIASTILSRHEWDLAFVFFGYLDIIQHFFWRYFDPSDPTYPGPTPFQNVIREFYILLDRIVGELVNLHPDSIVVVFSDHGHGMRPPRTVNINECLREAGLLCSRNGVVNPAPYLLENIKRVVLDFIHRFELDHWMLEVSRRGILSSVTKSLYMSRATIDMERTVACLSSFAGPKSYPYGGVEIIRENLKKRGMEYEEVRSRVIHLLSQLKEPETGRPLVEWACRREDLYSGSYLDLYPDVLFELREGYGVYWGIHTPLIGTAYEHNLAPGGHRKEAVFLLSNAGRPVSRYEMTLEDIAPTVLDLLGLEGDWHFDGCSILI